MGELALYGIKMESRWNYCPNSNQCSRYFHICNVRVSQEQEQYCSKNHERQGYNAKAMTSFCVVGVDIVKETAAIQCHSFSGALPLIAIDH
mmetsp:Transcript_3548/g.9068  ORF Transcript_3548/g.9068 Transcript_3548/m.9068 type:complete len:91 (-) Transcript_3548:99-371(-)